MLTWKDIQHSMQWECIVSTMQSRAFFILACWRFSMLCLAVLLCHKAFSSSVGGVRRFAISFCFAISYSALLVRSNHIPTDPHQKYPLLLVSSVPPVRWWSHMHSSPDRCGVVGSRLSLRGGRSGRQELLCGEPPYIGLSLSLLYNVFIIQLSSNFSQ